nr:MAG TPA: hypothetical protein [Caudoviricetes sp.]
MELLKSYCLAGGFFGAVGKFFVCGYPKIFRTINHHCSCSNFPFYSFYDCNYCYYGSNYRIYG